MSYQAELEKYILFETELLKLQTQLKDLKSKDFLNDDACVAFLAENTKLKLRLNILERVGEIFK